MKKILAITGLCLFAFIGTSFGAALSTGGTTAAGDSVYGGPSSAAAADATEAILVGKLSKGVKAAFQYDYSGYAVATKHDSGNQAFGTADDSTAIYRTNVGSGAVPVPADIGNTSFALWTQM